MPKYEIFKSKGEGEQCWRWRLMDDNGKVIVRSEEAFVKSNCLASLKRIRQEIATSPVWKDESPEDREKGFPFEYFQNNVDGKWYCRLHVGNHETMAVDEGFSSEDAIKTTLEKLKKEMRDAKITWENPEDDPAYQEKHDDRTETKGIPGS